jgi:hypothetical protein
MVAWKVDIHGPFLRFRFTLWQMQDLVAKFLYDFAYCLMFISVHSVETVILIFLTLLFIYVAHNVCRSACDGRIRIVSERLAILE